MTINKQYKRSIRLIFLVYVFAGEREVSCATVANSVGKQCQQYLQFLIVELASGTAQISGFMLGQALDNSMNDTQRFEKDRGVSV